MSLWMQALLSVLLLTMMPMPAAARQMSETTEFRLNYGVIFTPTEYVHASNQYWSHLFKVRLPDANLAMASRFPVCQTPVNTQVRNRVKSYHALSQAPEPTPPPAKCINQSSPLYDALEEYDNVQLKLKDMMNDTLSKIKVLIPSQDKLPSPNSRSKRSLLPFLGSLGKSLFGLATENDVKTLAKHIDFLEKNNRQTGSLFESQNKKLTSFMQTTSHRIANAVQQITSNSDQILMLDKHLLQLDNLLTYSLHLTRVLTHQAHLAVSLEYHLENFLQSVYQLQAGKLSPLLIPPESLQKVINHVRHVFATKYPDFHLVHTDPSYYYESPHFLATRKGNVLIVYLKLFVSTHPHLLTVYQVTNMVVPLNDSTNHGTTIDNLSPYLALTKDRQFYTDISTVQWQQCLHINDHYKECPFNLILTSTSQMSCTLALFLNLKQPIHDLCSFHFLLNSVQPHVMEFPPNTLVLSRIQSGKLQCQGTLTSVDKCPQLCLLHVPCFCSLQLQDFFVPPRVTNCHNDTDVTMQYGINLILIQKFFDLSSHESILPDSLFARNPVVTIPDFHLYQHHYSDFIASDHQYKLNLDRVISAVKNDTPIFQTLSEPLLADLPLHDSDTFPSNIISIKYLALLISSLALLISFYLAYRLRALLLVVLTLKQATPVHALTLPPLHYPTTTTPSTLTSHMSYTTAPWLTYMSLFLQCMSCLCLIALLISYWQRRRSDTTLSLKLISGLDYITIPLRRLHDCPITYHTQTSNFLPKVGPLTYCLPTVTLDWTDLVLTHKPTMKTVSLPSKVTLSPYTLWKISKMVKQPFLAYLVFQHGKYETYIQLCPLDCPCLAQTPSPTSAPTLYPSVNK